MRNNLKKGGDPLLPKRRKRKTCIDPDMELTQELRGKALRYWEKKGVEIDVDHEFEKFVVWHTERATKYVSWSSAWRTWYVNAYHFAKRPSNASSLNKKVYDSVGTQAKGFV